jgi:conjugative relaxase-like TrwC/TraI family protein
VGTPLRTIGPVISIGRISAGDAAGYYLEKQAGCDLDYYTGEGESRGRWLGDGARALGLDGPLDEVGEHVLRALLSGFGPAGDSLVGPVLRADPRSRLDAAPLIRALESVRQQRGGADLLGEGTLVSKVEAAAVSLDDGRAATLPVEVVGQVAQLAGLDPVALYRGADGTDVYGEALRYAGAQVDVRRPGLDVTVSAPKSVSFLYGLGDPAVARAARSAHHVAVGEVISYLQRHAATAVRGHYRGAGSATRIATDGLIVAMFEHRTSRAGDPQLHTHLVIPNLVRGIDRRWSAMNTAAIYKHARTASSLYHAVLRGELTRQLGVDWTPIRRGIADIHGIPRPVIDRFSKRRTQVVDAMERRGTRGPKAAQAACLATRPPKKPEQPSTLRSRWQAEAAAAGVTAETLGRAFNAIAVPGEPNLGVLAGHLFGADGVTADQTTFTRQELARAVCEALPAGMPVRLADIDRLVTALIAHPDVVPILGDDAAERRYSTRELLETEQTALQLATEPPACPVGVTTMRRISAVLDRTDLSAEQKVMVHALVTSGRRVDVVAGPAGCGKTAALAIAHRAWAHANHPVRGATVSWLAAQQLEAATYIPTRSLAQTMRHADLHGLPAGVVLVLDEASLVNTRTLAKLLHHVHAADGKLVLVGDPYQLPEIGAGGLFAALAQSGDAIRLSGNQRQQAKWERAALQQLRGGDIIGALDAYLDNGRIHTAPDHDDLLAGIATAYAAAKDRGEDVLVLAGRRADVSRLNRTIREHLTETGRLGSHEVTVQLADGHRSYRTGDQVLVTVNDRTRGLLNGSRATVTAADTKTGSVQVQLENDRRITLDSDWLTTGNLAHGYAVTVHKAQGLTIDTALVYGVGPLTHEHAYVALSRGRVSNHIYVAADAIDAPECGPRAQPADQDDQALTAELLERISTSRRQRIANSYRLVDEPARGRFDDWTRRLVNENPVQDRAHGRSM